MGGHGAGGLGGLSLSLAYQLDSTRRGLYDFTSEGENLLLVQYLKEKFLNSNENMKIRPQNWIQKRASLKPPELVCNTMTFGSFGIGGSSLGNNGKNGIASQCFNSQSFRGYSCSQTCDQTLRIIYLFIYLFIFIYVSH